MTVIDRQKLRHHLFRLKSMIDDIYPDFERFKPGHEIIGVFTVKTAIEDKKTDAFILWTADRYRMDLSKFMVVEPPPKPHSPWDRPQRRSLTPEDR